MYIFLYCLGEEFHVVKHLRAITKVSPRFFMIHTVILVLPQLLKTKSAIACFAMPGTSIPSRGREGGGGGRGEGGGGSRNTTSCMQQKLG